MKNNDTVKVNRRQFIGKFGKAAFAAAAWAGVYGAFYDSDGPAADAGSEELVSFSDY